MGAAGYTKQEKANAFYRIANQLWDKVNPPAIKSTYYASLAHAGLG